MTELPYGPLATFAMPVALVGAFTLWLLFTDIVIDALGEVHYATIKRIEQFFRSRTEEDTE